MSVMSETGHTGTVRTLFAVPPLMLLECCRFGETLTAFGTRVRAMAGVALDVPLDLLPRGKPTRAVPFAIGPMAVVMRLARPNVSIINVRIQVGSAAEGLSAVFPAAWVRVCQCGCSRFGR
jgi:hypothetical protein